MNGRLGPTPAGTLGKVPAKRAPLVAPAVAVEVTIPVRTISGSNAREHWAAKARRVKGERAAVYGTLLALGVPRRPIRADLRPTVTLARLGGRRLDDDNLRAALKHVRDEVAAWLGIDDGDPAVTWLYGQWPAGPAGVRVRVEATAP